MRLNWRRGGGGPSWPPPMSQGIGKPHRYFNHVPPAPLRPHYCARQSAMSHRLHTVLLVDDDPAMLARFRHVLEQDLTLSVATAPSGSEGLTLARELRPDLIVSDYEMPGMDGLELCRQVKADPDLARCRFVVLSGFSDAAAKARGRNLGVDDYLTKPIEMSELVDRV